MANIRINQTPTRAQYEASNGQTVFNYNFPIKEPQDLKVYIRGANVKPEDPTQLLTFGVDYTVTGANTATGGTVVLAAGAALNDVVTIVGDRPIDRIAIYDQSVSLSKDDLNNDFNDNVMFDKQIDTIAQMLTPQYHRSELIFRDLNNPGNNVRAGNLYLPILNNGDIWIGRGNRGDNPDDITVINIADITGGGGGGGAPVSADYILGTANVLLPNAQPLGGLGTGFLFNTDDGTTGTLSVVNPANIGNTTEEVIQMAHSFNVGDVVRRDGGTNSYILAQGDNAANAEAIGIVKEVIDGNTFVLQQSGFIDTLSGLSDGNVYFLSPSTPGLLTTTEPTLAGQVSKPMLIAVSPTEGWILPYRGQIIGPGGSGGGGGGGGSGEEVVKTINQVAHGFSVGNILRRDGGTNTYVLAQADSATNAEVVGIVSNVVDADNFDLTQVGYIDGLTGLTDGECYFLNPTVAGGYTATEPTALSEVSRPVLIADSNTSGWFLHYRGYVIDTAITNALGSQVLVDFDITMAATTYNFDDIFSANYDYYEIIVQNIATSGSTTSRLGLRLGNGSTYLTSDYGNINASPPTSYINVDTVVNNEISFRAITNNLVDAATRPMIYGSGQRYTLPGPNSGNQIVDISGHVNTPQSLTSLQVGIYQGNATIQSGKIIVIGYSV